MNTFRKSPRISPSQNSENEPITEAPASLFAAVVNLEGTCGDSYDVTLDQHPLQTYRLFEECSIVIEDLEEHEWYVEKPDPVTLCDIWQLLG